MNGERSHAILTPEHVQIRLKTAGLGARFLAITIDSALVICAAVLLDRVLRMILPGSVERAASMIAVFALTWSYHAWFELRSQGRTPGKKFLGLRVVDGRGLPLAFHQSLVRNVARSLDFLPVFYAFGGLAALFDPRGRRLGDLAADTLVIRDDPALEFREHLAPDRRHNSLRTPRVLRFIRHRIGLEEREFLLALCWRAGELEPQVRFDLMEEVGGHYRRVLEIEDPHLSGENLVRGLTAILYEK